MGDYATVTISVSVAIAVAIAVVAVSTVAVTAVPVAVAAIGILSERRCGRDNGILAGAGRNIRARAKRQRAVPVVEGSRVGGVGPEEINNFPELFRAWRCSSVRLLYRKLVQGIGGRRKRRRRRGALLRSVHRRV